MRRLNAWSLVVISCCIGVAACSGGDGDSGSSGSGAGGTSGSGGQDGMPMFRGECPSAEQIGYFYVQHETDYSVVSGEVLDGVVPSKILFQVGQDGDCILWQRKNPFCNPACMANQTCSQDSTCVPYPLPKDVGQTTISGLSKPVSMTFPNYYDTTIMHPAFQPGAAVTLKALGADFSGFTLYGQGFAPMVIPMDMLVVKKGEVLNVSWTPDNSADHATVRVRVNIDQHGNSPVELVCDVKDTGSMVIPVTLIDQLVGFGVTGFPSIHVSRHTLDSVNIGPGCVQFEVFSHRLGNLQVANHIPCDAATPCPMPMTCDIPTGTCK